jgi:glycosyltransferase involved in cell wall biosynthesis
MRIAFFCANLIVGQDGVTRVMYRIMEAARSKGHGVMAFTASEPGAGETDIPMHKVPSFSLPLQRAYRIALPGYHFFAKALSAFKPDLLHIHSPCPLGFAAARYAKAHGLPAVATYHTHFPTYLRYYNLSALEQLSWTLMRWLYNKVERTFVPTIPILEELRGHGIHRLQYLSNGVDLTVFNPSHRSNEWRAQFGGGARPIVLFCSRLVWEKNLRVLADMYNSLRARRDDFEMVLVGDGHARAELEAMMPGAHFLGYKSGSTLSQSYASADIFVFPSTTETFGLVTLEAMASGMVPIAARYGGAVQIIEDGKSGYLAQPNDATDLTRKVLRILDSPADLVRLRANALDRARAFGWDTILESLLTQYGEVQRDFVRRFPPRAV